MLKFYLMSGSIKKKLLFAQIQTIEYWLKISSMRKRWLWIEKCGNESVRRLNNFAKMKKKKNQQSQIYDWKTFSCISMIFYLSNLISNFNLKLKSLGRGFPKKKLNYYVRALNIDIRFWNILRPSNEYLKMSLSCNILL